jgi:hypothetical protein
MISQHNYPNLFDANHTLIPILIVMLIGVSYYVQCAFTSSCPCTELD